MQLRTICLIALLVLAPGICQADSFLLRSGRVIRGKLVEKKAGLYVVSTDEGNVEVPISDVSIADIDPASNTLPRGTVSVLNGPDKEEKSQKETNEPMTVIAIPDTATTPEAPHFANSGVLKNAEDTVNLHNKRTREAEERIGEMKKILEGSSSAAPDET